MRINFGSLNFCRQCPYHLSYSHKINPDDSCFKNHKQLATFIKNDGQFLLIKINSF